MLVIRGVEPNYWSALVEIPDDVTVGADRNFVNPEPFRGNDLGSNPEFLRLQLTSEVPKSQEDK